MGDLEVDGLLRAALTRQLAELRPLSPEALRRQRGERFMALGVFEEA